MITLQEPYSGSLFPLLLTGEVPNRLQSDRHHQIARPNHNLQTTADGAWDHPRCAPMFDHKFQAYERIQIIA
jgi:hypothetical protein